MGNATALELLDIVTKPLAHLLICQMTLNPDVGFTVLTGGVVESLNQEYVDALTRNLVNFALYGVRDQSEDYYRGKIGLGNLDGLDVLRGAAIFSRGMIFV